VQVAADLIVSSFTFKVLDKILNVIEVSIIFDERWEIQSYHIPG